MGNKLTKDELRDLLHTSGVELKSFFNTSGKLYKELNLKEKVPTSDTEELLDFLASDGMLVRRPLLTNGQTVLVGFKEAEWEEKVR